MNILYHCAIGQMPNTRVYVLKQISVYYMLLILVARENEKNGKTKHYGCVYKIHRVLQGVKRSNFEMSKAGGIYLFVCFADPNVGLPIGKFSLFPRISMTSCDALLKHMRFPRPQLEKNWACSRYLQHIILGPFVVCGLALSGVCPDPLSPPRMIIKWIGRHWRHTQKSKERRRPGWMNHL